MMKKEFTIPGREAGLTLVELMVALVISLLLIAGTITIFTSNKQVYRVNDASSRVQENGRFALDFLRQDVRMAGYKGCSADGPLTNTLKCLNGTTRSDAGVCTGNDIENNFNLGVEGIDDVTASPPTYLTAEGITPNVGTDVIIIRKNSDNPISIIKNNSSAQVFVELTSELSNGCSGGGNTTKYSGFCEGDILMVTDCSKSRVFQVTNLSKTGSGSSAELNIAHASSGSPGNDPSSWGGSSAPEEETFGTDAEIARVETSVYYIADGTSGEPALFRKEGTNTPVELIEGIEDMNVTYGVDNDNDGSANYYVNAQDVTTEDVWADVMSARIQIIARSLTGNLTQTGDGRLRHTFTETIKIRNRI